MPKMEFRKGSLDIPIDEIKNVVRNSEFFNNDCEEMLNKSLGSYVVGYDNCTALRDKILNSTWRFNGTELSEDNKIEHLIFTVKIDCYDGILDTNKLKSKDIIFAIPANRLVDYKPVVLSPTGIATKYMSIAVSNEETGLKYLGLYVGRKKKPLIMSLAYGAEIEYKLLNAKWLKGYNCTNILRIDSSISAKYIMRIAIRDAISKESKILENLYTKHCKHKQNYKAFLAELSELNWKQSNNNPFIYTAVGMEGYRKYLNLDSLDSDFEVNVYNKSIVRDKHIPSLIIDNVKAISHTLTIKVYVAGNRISIVDAYFGDMPRDELSNTEGIPNSLKVSEALHLGFNKARVSNYSPFDELSLDIFMKYINDINKYKNVKYKHYGSSKEIEPKFLEQFSKANKMYYKEVTVPNDLPNNYLELIKDYIDNCELISCGQLIYSKDRLTVLDRTALKQTKKILIEIQGDSIFEIGGIRNEVLIHKPKLINIFKII